MKYIIASFFCVVLFQNGIAQNNFSNINLSSGILFDDDWRFHRGNIKDAEEVNFDDASWRGVQLPHDWSIEDLPGTNSPFNPDVVNGVGIGFTTGGTGWYRKTFVVPATQKNKKIFIQFDAVYMNADVWLNGEHLGNHPYGYTSFLYDITDKIKWGGKNIIAVQVKNEGATSRWYSGSGIYRHVWLKITEPAHAAQSGIYITTPDITSSAAKTNIKTKVLNESVHASSISVITKILDSKGRRVAETNAEQIIQAKNSFEFTNEVVIKSPQLWSTESPVLYTCITEVYSDKKLSDRTATTFGIRSISFDAQHGFLLNGKSVKLKGACFHNDNGPLGSRSYDRAEIRRVQLLKASGFNAIRCSHNPPPTAFLDACDSLGMLVIDEAFDMWGDGKNDQDYHLYFKDWWKQDLQAILFRDRNHPSIIMWSIGNEIPGMDNPSVADTAKMLADFVRNLEPTRPVTAAVNSVSGKKDAFFSALDISGYNYAKDNYESDHKRMPERIMFGSESYALTAFDYWMSVVDHPWVIGDFVWTGFDYIGEASIGWRGYPQETNFYPWNLAYCGDIDICGWKRPQSFYRDALWKENQLSIFVKPPSPSFPVNPKKEDWSIWNWDDVVADWTWKGYDDTLMEVNVYSSCEEVELFLNDKSLGKKQTNRSTKFMAKWNVPYTSGELKAVGYNGSQKVNSTVLHTAKEVSVIKLSADRAQIKADGQDLSYITVELLDENDIRNPKAENLIHFTIQGNGTIVGVGNANPVSIESYGQPMRKAWQGKCMVVIKAGKGAGKLTVSAACQGLKTKMITIECK